MFTTGIWPNSATTNPMCRSLESIYLGSEEDLFFLPSTSSSSSTCSSASREDFYWVPSSSTTSPCTFSRSYPLDSFTHFEHKQQSTSFARHSNLKDERRRHRCSIGTQTTQEESEEHSLKEQCHSIAIQLFQLADEFKEEIEQRKQQKWRWSSLFSWKKALPEMPQENTAAGILLNLIASWMFSSAILPQ
uniref:Uncharacterized protein n=1 Tax=Ditylenchus dipsaci TaxID=166011 RepID=A0A915CRP9_9BILA